MRDAHLWLRRPSWPTAILFTVAVAVLILFCTTSLDRAYAELVEPSYRSIDEILSFLGLLTGGWVGGWFIVLFVDAESLKVTAPVDYRAWCVLAGAALIAASIGAGALLMVLF